MSFPYPTSSWYAHLRAFHQRFSKEIIIIVARIDLDRLKDFFGYGKHIFEKNGGCNFIQSIKPAGE